MKIATHNSATCMKGKGLLSWLATPFARCQSKSIKEQYDAGCRYFDIRVRQDTKYNGQFYVCHGIWRTSTLLNVLVECFNSVILGEHIMLDITWEGDVSDWSEARKKAFVNSMHAAVDATNDMFNSKEYEYLKPLWLMSVQGKKPHGTVFWQSSSRPKMVQSFKGLYWFTWRLLIPIPWVWRKIYGQATFNDEYYTQVDFL